ncbi:MAG: Ni/Fe-hydrogenase cytochrome b subunit [Deltaproteobacteria bacterium]|nr:Ni/Fe-hydrogenase cytochrome b subunit [Deltaproteobacteria bacterium]
MTVTKRLKITKNILWLITGVGVSAGAARLIHGLGATTALTDVTSWGIWIGFDVMGGVALAAGGFVIAGIVYIFHIGRFHPLLRPTVLTAFLGYLAVIAGLILDIGRPWMIWSPTINWQLRSALFEIAWCVMLYTTVLALEFAPVVLERFFRTHRVLKFFKKISIPLVIAGIMLSTMHQSTLGTLFVIMPFRVHPLWYTTWLPMLFFVSAVALGLAMVICESIVSGWLFQRKLEKDLLTSVARGANYVLIFYLFLVIVNLAVYGKLHHLVDGTWESLLYWFELAVSTLIPIALFSSPRIRSTTAGLGAGALMIVLGFVVNRINMAITSMIPTTGANYFPSWMEIAISLSIVSAVVLIFFFFVEHCDVYESRLQREHSNNDLSRPVFDRSTDVWLGPNLIRNTSVHFIFFLIGASLSFALLPERAVHGALPEKTPVTRPRGLDPMIIDGNHANLAVIFDHSKHIREHGKAESCVKCHHMQKPMDQATSCSECHRDMFLKTLIFNHSFHERKLGGNKGCEKCHEKDHPKAAEYVKACEKCHTKMAAKGSRISLKTKGLDRFKFAVGYADALHELCIACHKEKAMEYKEKRLLEERLVSIGSPRVAEPERIAQERLHFCPTCHRELHYTNDPVPEIILPKKENRERSIPVFLEEMKQPQQTSKHKEIIHRR